LCGDVVSVLCRQLSSDDVEQFGIPSELCGDVVSVLCRQLSSDDVEQFGIPSELCCSLLMLAKKLASLSLSLEEYVLLKAVVLLNPGIVTPSI